MDINSTAYEATMARDHKSETHQECSNIAEARQLPRSIQGLNDSTNLIKSSFTTC